MPSVLRNGFTLALVLASAAVFFAACSKPAEVAKPDLIVGSALLKQFDARQDLKSSPAMIADFISLLGAPKSSRREDGDEIVTWYYARYNHADAVGESVTYEAHFNPAGVFTGADGKHASTLNLFSYLKRNLTPQELGTALPKTINRSAETATVTPCEYKRVSFAVFFGAELASVPLSFEIPQAYVLASGFAQAGPSWSATPAASGAWMRSAEVAAAVASHHLPEAGGFMRGQKLPSAVDSFNPASAKFQNEDQLESFLSRRRLTLLSRQRLEVKGHPIFAYLARSYEGILLGTLSIATVNEVPVLGIIYRPVATDNLATVRATWDHILMSLQ